MSYKAGSAFVTVRPDMRSFHRDIADKLRGEDATFAKAGDRWGKLAGDAFRERMRGSFADLPKATIKASADTTRARAEIDKAARTRDMKIRVHTEFLKSPALLGFLGAAALGPTALGLGAGALGIGAAFGAAGAGAASFGVLAKAEITKVTKAQEALTKAQQAYAKATTPAQRKKALEAEALATKGLSASEMGLGHSLTLLSDSWKQLGRSEAPLIARSLKPWFDVATEGLRFLPKLANPAGQAIESLGKQAGKALQAPFWGHFFTVLGQTGKTALLGFGKAAGHVADAFAHLFVTFAPDLRKLPGLVDKWAASFDRWASSYKRSGFDAFMSKTFSKGNVASLKDDLKALGTTLGNVAKATANLSPAAFLGLSKVLEILSKLSPGQIEAIGALYAVGKLTGSSSYAGILKRVLGGKGAKAAEAEGTAAASRFGSYGPGAALLGPPGLNAAAAAGAAEWLRSQSDASAPRGTNAGRSSAALQGSGFLSTASLATIFGGWEANLGLNMTRWWSGAYQGFQRDFAGKVTSWFTTSLPHAFANAGSWLKGAGKTIAGGIVAGWDGAKSFVTGSFGHARAWADSATRTAGRWLSGTGRAIAHGLAVAWDATAGFVTSSFRHAKSWASRGVSGAGSWLLGTGRSIGRGLVSGWNATAGFVRASVGKAYRWVTGVFANAGTWLFDIGKKLVGGMVSGILSVGDSIKNTLLGLIPAPLRGVLGKVAGWVGFASGTPSAPRGWAWVGERGPELMRFRGGEAVLPHAASMALMRSMASVAAPARLPGMGSAAPGPLALTVRYAGPSNGAIGAIVKDLRYDIQATTGGDAQKYWGRGKART